MDYIWFNYGDQLFEERDLMLLSKELQKKGRIETLRAYYESSVAQQIIKHLPFFHRITFFTEIIEVSHLQDSSEVHFSSDLLHIRNQMMGLRKIGPSEKKKAFKESKFVNIMIAGTFKGIYSLYVMILAFEIKEAAIFSRMTLLVTNQELEELIRAGPEWIVNVKKEIKEAKRKSTVNTRKAKEECEFFAEAKEAIERLFEQIKVIEAEVNGYKKQVQIDIEESLDKLFGIM